MEGSAVTHEDVLNLLLANACPDHRVDDSTNAYRVELHCAEFVITARPLGEGRYEVLAVSRSWSAAAVFTASPSKAAAAFSTTPGT
jgi:hypothetical protein